MITKLPRHFAIKEIIGSKQIASQDELRHELRKKGFEVTQATLSRDLRDLGVGRIATGEGSHYVLQPAAEVKILSPLVGAQVLAVTANESLIVIRTLPGSASVIGEYVDSLGHEDVIGTIAGDNALLVIPRSHTKTSHIVKFLKQKFIQGVQ